MLRYLVQRSFPGGLPVQFTTAEDGAGHGIETITQVAILDPHGYR
jgi:hypothetical protein